MSAPARSAAAKAILNAHSLEEPGRGVPPRPKISGRLKGNSPLRGRCSTCGGCSAPGSILSSLYTRGCCAAGCCGVYTSAAVLRRWLIFSSQSTVSARRRNCKSVSGLVYIQFNATVHAPPASLIIYKCPTPRNHCPDSAGSAASLWSTARLNRHATVHPQVAPVNESCTRWGRD